MLNRLLAPLFALASLGAQAQGTVYRCPGPPVLYTDALSAKEAHDKVVIVNAQAVKEADIVFIDALHDYDSVYEDIRLWWPRVRVGGMLCGHDFNHQWPGVERAVADSFNLMQVGVTSDSVWFVLKQHEDQLRASTPVTEAA